MNCPLRGRFTAGDIGRNESACSSCLSHLIWQRSATVATQGATLINPAAPLHGGSLVVGTSVLVISKFEFFRLLPLNCTDLVTNCVLV